jgi:hypothetical protein
VSVKGALLLLGYGGRPGRSNFYSAQQLRLRRQPTASGLGCSSLQRQTDVHRPAHSTNQLV